MTVSGGDGNDQPIAGPHGKPSGNSDTQGKHKPILVISGAPGAGKTTLSLALGSLLEERGERAIVIPVDDLRGWVKSGLADTLPEWTEETSRQFALAEDAVASVARLYANHGFWVLIDHCRLPDNVLTWQKRSLGFAGVSRIAIVIETETVLQQNAARQNKSFDPVVLTPVIQSVNQSYLEADLSGWHVLDQVESPEARAERLLELLCD
ncbi:MAG: zeta toxin family protein [Fimbriimonadaceae bacterium]|nr:zeta toxin family protein [Fimbriimonadaceae bacterium]